MPRPILPAPARRMVPVMFWRVLFAIAVATNSVSSRRRPGPITTGGSSGWRAEQQASCDTEKSRGMGPGSARALGALVRDDVGEDGEALRLAHRIEHRSVHRVRRGLARPHHGLERGEIALAGVDGAGEHGFALRG